MIQEWVVVLLCFVFMVHGWVWGYYSNHKKRPRM